MFSDPIDSPFPKSQMNIQRPDHLARTRPNLCARAPARKVRVAPAPMTTTTPPPARREGEEAAEEEGGGDGGGGGGGGGGGRAAAAALDDRAARVTNGGVMTADGTAGTERLLLADVAELAAVLPPARLEVLAKLIGSLNTSIIILMK